MPFKRLMPGPQWSIRAGADSITDAGLARKIKYGQESKLLWYVTGTPDGSPASVGILRISADYGESWANGTLLAACDGCLDMAEDPSGNLWGLFYNSAVPGGGAGYTAKVGYSTDGGSSWALKKTHTAAKQAFNIAVSPKRAADVKVAFVAADTNGLTIPTKYQLVVSVDSGATWATRDIVL